VRQPGKRKQSQLLLRFDRATATAPLPEHLKVRLGKTIRVGALEVTPLKVRRQKMSILVKGFDRGEPLPTDSLVLYLKLKNVSSDGAFTPLDNYFDRQWKGVGPAPLTVLRVGKKSFFGGPAPWTSELQSTQRHRRRQWIEGRKDIDWAGLQPGKDDESFVCTDGSDPEVARFLFGEDGSGQRVGVAYHGPLLWRVHVRRGLITRNGKRYSATAVIGVEFSDEDYAG
jgi:hypothetical protein